MTRVTFSNGALESYAAAVTDDACQTYGGSNPSVSGAVRKDEFFDPHGYFGWSGGQVILTADNPPAGIYTVYRRCNYGATQAITITIANLRTDFSAGTAIATYSPDLSSYSTDSWFAVTVSLGADVTTKKTICSFEEDASNYARVQIDYDNAEIQVAAAVAGTETISRYPFFGYDGDSLYVGFQHTAAGTLKLMYGNQAVDTGVSVSQSTWANYYFGENGDSSAAITADITRFQVWPSSRTWDSLDIRNLIPIGTNDGRADYGAQLLFTNLWRHSGGGSSSSKGRAGWGCYASGSEYGTEYEMRYDDESDAASGKVELDADGWPTRIDSGYGANRFAISSQYTQFITSRGGNIVLKFTSDSYVDGTCPYTFWHSTTSLSATWDNTAKTATIAVSAFTSGQYIRIQQTYTDATNPPKVEYFAHEDDIATLDSAPFISEVTTNEPGAGALRGMPMTQAITSWGTIALASATTLPKRVRKQSSSGVYLNNFSTEVFIDWCNAKGQRPWVNFCVPRGGGQSATLGDGVLDSEYETYGSTGVKGTGILEAEAFITWVAQYVKDNNTSGKPAIFELGDEWWNYGGAVWRYDIQEIGEAMFGSSGSGDLVGGDGTGTNWACAAYGYWVGRMAELVHAVYPEAYIAFNGQCANVGLAQFVFGDTASQVVVNAYEPFLSDTLINLMNGSGGRAVMVTAPYDNGVLAWNDTNASTILGYATNQDFIDNELTAYMENTLRALVLGWRSYADSKGALLGFYEYGWQRYNQATGSNQTDLDALKESLLDDAGFKQWQADYHDRIGKLATFDICWFTWDRGSNTFMLLKSDMTKYAAGTEFLHLAGQSELPYGVV